MNTPGTDFRQKASTVVSVVVTYQPDEALIENVRRIAGQCAEVVIVDNASSGPAAERVAEAARLEGVILIRNPANLGIASALNLGIRKALEKNFRWIATFDQDTRVPEDFFGKMLRTFSQCSQPDTVAMIVPGGWTECPVDDRETGEPTNWSFVLAALSSGCLIKSGTLQKIGGFDEDFFIDYVDVDFCLRLQKHGLKILSADSVVLEHELGHKQTRTVFGRQISFRIHSAWRYYYIFRNRIVIFRRFFATAPRWILRDGFWLVPELIRICLLEHGRRQKLRAAFCGMKDGVIGRIGRHEKYPP